MPLNETENYLRERRDRTLLNFSDNLTTNSTYLRGAGGGTAGDGYPLPAPGKVLRLYVWDGLNVRTSTVASSFNAGDRISVYASYSSPYFYVTVRINGVDTATFCDIVLSNSTLRVSVLVRLDVY